MCIVNNTGTVYSEGDGEERLPAINGSKFSADDSVVFAVMAHFLPVVDLHDR